MEGLFSRGEHPLQFQGTGARLSNVILKVKSIKASEGRQYKNLAATVSMQQCYSEYHGRTGGRATNPLPLLLLLQLLAPPVVSTTTIPTGQHTHHCSVFQSPIGESAHSLLHTFC